MDLIITILPVVTKDLPISPRFTPYNFFSRCKFSTLTTRQPMVEFYLLTFPRFPLRKKKHTSYFGKNRTHDFRTSRCAGYLLYHSEEYIKYIVFNIQHILYSIQYTSYNIQYTVYNKQYTIYKVNVGIVQVYNVQNIIYSFLKMPSRSKTWFRGMSVGVSFERV